MRSLYIRLCCSGSVNRQLHQCQGVEAQLYEEIDDKTCPSLFGYEAFRPKRIAGEFGHIIQPGPSTAVTLAV